MPVNHIHNLVCKYAQRQPNIDKRLQPKEQDRLVPLTQACLVLLSIEKILCFVVQHNAQNFLVGLFHSIMA